MPVKFSAYLSVYNDWDILPDALRSIAPYIDELVLVDGAYEWMLPYFAKMGTDPKVSNPQVRAAAEASGIKLRIVSGVWKSEVEKRIAGYEACLGRYVFRIDADEILLFHDAALAGFLASGAAVAEMEMPIVAAPGLIRVSAPDAAVERQCLLFDKQQIDAATHLHYLWLVLGSDSLPPADTKLPIFPEPIAFNSHLTGWRTPATASTRASFYTLNYTRTYGMPWTKWVRETAVRDISVLLSELVTPSVYHDLLLTGPLIVGEANLKTHSLRTAPYGTASNPRITELHDNFLASLAALNGETAEIGRHFVNGDPLMIDLTTEAAIAALGGGPDLTLDIPARPVTAEVKLYYELTAEPWHLLEDVPHTYDGNRLTMQLPPAPRRETFLRRILRIEIWCAASEPIHRFTIVRD